MATIREKLKAQMFKAKVAAFSCWGLVAAGIFLPKGNALQALWLIPFAGFAGSILYIQFFVKCPKCRARLGHALSVTSKPNFCPSCGVDFDSRVQA